MSEHVISDRESSSRVRAAIVVFVAAIVVSGVACWIVAALAPVSFRGTMAWFLSAAALLLSAACALAVFGYVGVRELRAELNRARVEADNRVLAAGDMARAELDRHARQVEEAKAAAREQLRSAREQAEAERTGFRRQLAETRALAEADRRAIRRETDAEASRIVDQVVPTLLTRLGEGASADTALAEIDRISRWGLEVVTVLARQLGKVEQTKAAALAACASAASRMQAQTTSTAALLREMEDTADPGTLAGLLEVDHHNAQVGRLADSIAVLTGARSGRRWARPIAMESVLRGAMSRINDYRRVQLHAPVEVAVVGYAAEAVIHVLAELIDNAAQFSPPTERVHVYVEEAHAGVVVAIEDSGIGMMPRALARAEAAIAAPAGDLSSVNGSRLGLAVVGQLARKHELQVSYRPSARGGTGVVVMIPRRLVTEAQQPAPALPARRGELVAATATRSPAGSVATLEKTEPEAPAPGHPYQLARRQPGRTLAEQNARTTSAETAAKPRTDPGAAFGAFQRARTASKDGAATENAAEDEKNQATQDNPDNAGAGGGPEHSGADGGPRPAGDAPDA